jgi:ADP-ribosylglycohydrolase
LSGVLLGTAVGDALGLPREGLSPRRAARLFPEQRLSHHLLGGRGFLSDDTEHAAMVGQALLASGAEPHAFRRSLAWRLRGWLLGVPSGIGWATLRSPLKLWLFVPERWQGVRSAGNGPLMRAPLLGAVFGQTPALEPILLATTRITHTDPRALDGARLVAQAAAAEASGATRGAGFAADAWLREARDGVSSPDLRQALELVDAQLQAGSSAAEWARAAGLERGVTGFVNHTLPAVVFCWLRHLGDAEASLEAVIRLGGDADTTGAILGGVVGAGAGAAGLPQDWLNGIADRPRSVAWLRRLGERLAERFPGPGEVSEGPGPLPLAWPLLIPRNALFACVVLAHGFRRLAPPY